MKNESEKSIRRLLRGEVDIDRESDLFYTQPEWLQELHRPRPRHYAADICREPDRKIRSEMLKAVPIQFRSLVKQHVKNTFALRSKLNRP